MGGTVPTLDFVPMLPILLLAATATIVLLADLIVPQRGPLFSMWLSLIGMVLATAAIVLWVPTDATVFNAFLRYDMLGRWGAIISIVGGCLIALVSPRTIRLYELPAAEYFALLVFAVLGMALLCLGVELLTIFLTVETLAISICILAGLRRGSSKSSEAALKYFILGAFSGSFLLFGFAFLYGGAGGSTLLGQVHLSAAQPKTTFDLGCLVLGLALALAGFSFKLTLAPFHLYAADVFEGAPTPVAALLATGSKVAGVVALVHLISPADGVRISPFTRALSVDLMTLLWILAALSIIVGNVVALLQRNIKRMLAYSTIAHSGYLVIGIMVFAGETEPAGRADIESALLVYLAAYVIMNVAAFGVAMTLGRRGEENIEEYAGLARRSPWLAVAMTLAMLSLTGIPATVGFVGKFVVFARAVEAGFVLIVVLAVLGSAVSAYYYLRVVVAMYMHEPATEVAAEPIDWVQKAGLVLATVPIVVFGIFPRLLMAVLGAVPRGG